MKFNPQPKPEKKVKVKYKLKRLSIKRQKQEREYSKARREYLEAHPECEYKFEGCGFHSTEIDHTIRHDKNL